MSRGELATRYGVHPQTVSRWLADAGLPGTLPPPGPADLAAQAAAMYRSEPVLAAEVARRLGVPDRQVVAALRSQNIEFDPARRIAAGARRSRHDAGCSSNQIELLTGQAQVVVRDTMHRLGIPLRPEHHSPALARL